jgi:hypothetical protein
MKYMMLLVMTSSLVALWFTTHNLHAIIGSGSFMALVAIWAWRFPGSVEVYEYRINNNNDRSHQPNDY